MWKVTVNGLLARKLRSALTALAIVLGVTFVSGTFVLTDTLNRTFDNLVGGAFQHVSFEIRGKAAFSTHSETSADSTINRKPVPESLATQVSRLPGVAAVDGSVEGYAQFVSRDGNAIGGGSSSLGFSFDQNRELSSLRLVAGTAPTTADDVVMDKATATKYHYSVGDQVRVELGRSSPQSFRITGIVTFGDDNNLAGATLAGFYRPTAQSLFNARGVYDTINVLAKPGADNVALQRAITRILPPGVQVVNGQTVINELSSAVGTDLSVLSTALLAFALISLFVGAFTIFNTFSITVGQRTRELALLRVVGASRRQVFRSVLGEAALMGLAASLVGLGLGVLAAAGLKALLGAFGVTLPSAPLVFEPRTAVVGIAVGVGVTVISAIGPARRAVRIPPVAAMVAQTEEQGDPMRGRVRAGAAIALGGTAALVAGLATTEIALVGLGAAVVFIAIAMLAPTVARPLSSALGRPLALLGTSGRLGRENAMRSPRRTAQTASALMVGLALVSAIAVLGASLSASAKSEVDSAINAGYLISGPSTGFSTAVAPAVARLPGVGTVSTVYKGQFEVRGSLSSVDGVTPTNLSRTVNLAVTAGRGAPALAAGELLIDTTTASADHLSVGSVVPAIFAQTGRTTMRIGGIFKANPLIGSYVLGAPFFLSHFNDPLPNAVLVSARPGAQGVGSAVNRYLNRYPNVSVKTRSQVEQDQQNSVNTELGLVYVLLALAVAIALIGIVNTLMLSVFERTHELGLLRAVGMKRRQVKAMIRSEAVIIALFGAVIGVIIGTALGVAFAASLKNQGITEIVVPYGRLFAFLVLAAVLGLGAASWPARRAARLDVLRAIATD
jgi:putative ABC transport system permease protein